MTTPTPPGAWATWPATSTPRGSSRRPASGGRRGAFGATLRGASPRSAASSAAAGRSGRPALAASLARSDRPVEAWERLEEDLGGDSSTSSPPAATAGSLEAERTRLGELTARLESLDRLAEAPTPELGGADRAAHLKELRLQRDQARIALGEFQSTLLKSHGALAGRVARLPEAQATLPADSALVAWVDVEARGPNAAVPDGEHWGVAVRHRGRRPGSDFGAPGRTDGGPRTTPRSPGGCATPCTRGRGRGRPGSLT